ncbi:hypothetical protein, partial [Enterobacter hormaechei]|uniref:hypothetical protein n=1 Tax=Enterobacter hormaechei TaxID=158836 RepID=UPI001F30181A
PRPGHVFVSEGDANASAQARREYRGVNCNGETGPKNARHIERRLMPWHAKNATTPKRGRLPAINAFTT